MKPPQRAIALLLATGLLLAFPCGQLQAQAVNATLVGTVTDSSGAVVAQANVAITEVSTGIRRTTTTNESGNYVFSNLPPGVYDVTAESQGFKKALRAAIDIVVNSTVRVDLSLSPGPVSETVTVSEQTAILQTERADIGLKIDRVQVINLPSGNHNFQGLLNLVPGTVRAHREHSPFFNAQDSLRAEVNGQSGLFNTVQIEGVDDNERTGLLQVYIPPQEAIQTVDVTTANYTAEFGRVGGAVTNVSLKSGTNQFHGALYEYNRVSALSARDYFNRAPSPLPRTTYNYYGGAVGGPIIKNRTFFFFDLLHVADQRGQFNNLAVPIDDFRNGDFTSQLASGIKIYNPFSGARDGTGRVQFQCDAAGNPLTPNAQGVQPAGIACNKIPQQLISPIASKIVALIPHANAVGCPGASCPVTNNYQAPTHLFKSNTQFDIKVDHNWRTKDRLAFRFSRGVQNVTGEPIYGLAGGPNDNGGGAGFNGTGVQHQQSGAINETHIFSPTLIMEVRAGISHYRNIAHSTDFGTNAADALGIKGANLDSFTSGMSTINVQQFVSGNDPLIGYSASLPWDRGEVNINIVNNWTKIHRNHTFKWGADIRRLRDELVQAQTFSPRGRFTFGTGTTAILGSKTNLANNFAAFLLDMPTTVGRDVSVVSGSWRETEAFFYGQDTWHITPKLTLDGGLRWEYYEPAHAHRAGGYSNYDPDNNQLVLAGIGGNPIDLGRNTFYQYFAPRFGMAYRFKEKTVIRGGFGISYEPFPNNNYAFNFPVRQNQAFNNLTSFGPAVLTSSGAGSTTVVNMGCESYTAPCQGGFPTPTPAQLDPVISASAPLRLKEDYFVIDKNFEQPYVEAWNLVVQRALPGNWVLDVAYVGNHGVRIPMQLDLNAAQAPSLDANGKIQTNNCVQGNSTRPLCNAFGRSAATQFLFKRSTSNYNSLQVKFDRRWSHGFGLTTAYTYGKGLAYRSDAGSNEGQAYYQAVSGPAANFQRNYEVTSQNRTHTFVQTYVYELPFGKGKRWAQSGIVNAIAGGWQISGVMTIMSGRPLDWSSSGNSLAMSGSRQTPIQIAPFHVLGGIGLSSLWFDTSAFCQPGIDETKTKPNCPSVAPGVFGNMSRYTFAGPRFFNVDAGLTRRVHFTERVGLELRAEAFSLTNTPHFALPSANASDTNFGKITATDSRDPGWRSMQLAAKITF